MNDERVVETWAEAIGQRGSGYLVSGRLVLTAAHCVPRQTNAAVKVRRLNDAGWRNARVSWRGPDASCDAALLELEPLENGEEPYGLGDELVKFGTPINEVDWAAIGFPWADERDGVTEPERAQGQLDPATNSRVDPETGRRAPYALNTDVHLRRRTERESAWAGMSGAAVLSEGHVIGVVVEDADRFERRLLGVPIEWVLSDHDAARLICPDLEQVPLRPIWNNDGLLEPAIGPQVPRARQRERISRAVMLQARRPTVGRVGRDNDLTRLLDWCQQPTDLGRVRLVIGAGGSGKTRLGVDLCEELAGQGWICGFMPGSTRNFLPLFDLSSNRLVVLDEAIGHLDQLDAFLHDAGNMGHRGDESDSDWRLLVLARRAGPWWERRLVSRFPLLCDPQPYVLEPPSLDERQRLYRRVRKQCGERLGTHESQPAALPSLCDPVYENFAAIVERAILDADPRAADSETPDRHLSARLLRLESDTYWQPEAEAVGLGLDPQLLERVVALCSLVIADGPTTSDREAQAARWLRVIPDLADASEQTRRRVARWAHSLYETADCYLPELRPHLLATAAATNLVTDCPEVVAKLLDFSQLDIQASTPEQLESAVAQAVRVLSTLITRGEAGPDPEQLPSEVKNTLNLVVQSQLLDLVKLVVEHAKLPTGPNPTGKALSLEVILSETLRVIAPSPDLAAGVAELLPDSANLRLDELALVMREQAVIHHRTERNGATERLADALRGLSVKQHDLGRPGARDSATEGVGLLDRLLDVPEALPTANQSRRIKLASARANLANILCDLNSPMEAVKQAQQAKALLPVFESTHAHHDGSGQVRIEVLSNLAKALRHAGRGKEACDLSGQAETLAEELYRCEPDKYHDWYAIALRRHSAALGDIGRSADAVKKAGEAVKHFDIMVDHDPARWTYDKAIAHRNYAERLADVERWKDARIEAANSVGEWNNLAAKRAGAYDAEFAKAMIVLARSELNDQVPEEASRHISEAVERLTPMVDPSGTSPSRPDDILASAWAMSAAISHELGHREAASLAQSSVDCLLALRASDENNQLLALHLARSLYVLAVCTYETDHAAGATQAARAGELTSGLGHEPCHLPGFLREAYQRWERVATCA